MKKAGILLLIFLALGFLFDRLLMPGYVSHGSSAVIPDVTGMHYDDAARKLRKEGFEPKQRFHLKYLTGVDSTLVLSQNPSGGTKVKPGRNVWLVLNRREKPSFQMPDLSGRPEYDVRNALARLDIGIEDIQVTPVTEPEQDGKVLSQSVPSGVMVKPGATVALIVGRYEESDEGMTKIIVPDVLGMSVEQAWKVVTDAGLSKGEVRREYSAILVPNTVISQKPAVSSYASPGQSVDLTVVTGQ